MSTNSMETLDSLFRKRVGFPYEGALAFGHLPALFTATSLALPFENLAVVQQRGLPITRENLVTKLLKRNEGGLCYELNPLLYFFLLENGFDVTMVRGIVCDAVTRTFAATGHTHVTLLLRHQGRTFLADTGFGGYLPMCPVPMNGEVATSQNGEFRIQPSTGAHVAHGDFTFMLKQRHKDLDWRVGFVFESQNSITTAECEEIRRVIAVHPASNFNKRPLVTKLTERGSVTLTDTSLIITDGGQMSKEPVSPETFAELLERYFQLPTYAQ